MSDLSCYIETVSKILSPIDGADSVAEAEQRLWACYRRLDTNDQQAFVAVLIGELLTTWAQARSLDRTKARHRKLGGAE